MVQPVPTSNLNARPEQLEIGGLTLQTQICEQTRPSRLYSTAAPHLRRNSSPTGTKASGTAAAAAALAAPNAAAVASGGRCGVRFPRATRLSYTWSAASHTASWLLYGACRVDQDTSHRQRKRVTQCSGLHSTQHTWSLSCYTRLSIALLRCTRPTKHAGQAMIQRHALQRAT
jgi:hypothetical protein